MSTNHRPKRAEGKVLLGLWIEDELKHALEMLAEHDDRNLSDYTERELRSAVRREREKLDKIEPGWEKTIALIVAKKRARRVATKGKTKGGVAKSDQEIRPLPDAASQRPPMGKAASSGE